jgi:hypothetical protein
VATYGTAVFSFEFMLVEVSMMNMILGSLSLLDGGGISSSSVSSAIAGAPDVIASTNPAQIHLKFRVKAFIVVPSKNRLPVKIKVSPSPS